MTAPGESDWLLVGTGILLIVIILMVGNLFLRLHTLPERLAHKSQKLQFEIVAVLGLLALFTHIHAFWVAGLLLALVDLPDFGTPLRRIATSTEKIAGITSTRPLPRLLRSTGHQRRTRSMSGVAGVAAAPVLTRSTAGPRRGRSEESDLIRTGS